MNFKIGVLPASFDANLRFEGLCERIRSSPKTTWIHCNSGAHRAPQFAAGLMSIGLGRDYDQFDPELQIGGSVL